MRSTTEMYEQELLSSEKEKINLMPIIKMDVEQPTIIEVNWNGLKIGSLIVSTRSLDYSPSKDGFRIDLSVRNINPIK